MRLRLSTLLVLLTLTALTAGAQQQQPSPIDTPIFRSTVDAIELDAFVVDAEGNPVSDLTADDFEILEEGRPQDITAFAVVNMPIETTTRLVDTTVVPDVRTNEQPEGRIYLFAVDEIPSALVPRLRLRLRQFIEKHFGENDTAAIVYVGVGRSTDGQDFTNNRATLLRSIDRLSGGFGGGDLETAAANRAGVAAAIAAATAAATADTAAV